MCNAGWRQEWQIRFEGEQGVDWGGLQREFFTVLGRELFESKTHHGGGPLWAKMGSESAVLMHPHASATGERQLKYFNFAGRVMAKCLYDSVVKGSHHLLTVHFTRSLFKYVLGEPISYFDFETDDPQLFKSKVHFMLHNKIDHAAFFNFDTLCCTTTSTTQVHFMLHNNIDHAGLDLTFSEETFDSKGKLLKTTPLLPGGERLPVTDLNKRRYLLLLARHRLNLVAQPSQSQARAPQLEAFAEGFYAVIPPGALESFDEHELELLVCGMPEVAAEQLKAHVVYPDLHNAHALPIIQWFWQCVSNMSNADRARLLQFWTGSSQVRVCLRVIREEGRLLASEQQGASRQASMHA